MASIAAYLMGSSTPITTAYALVDGVLGGATGSTPFVYGSVTRVTVLMLTPRAASAFMNRVPLVAFENMVSMEAPMLFTSAIVGCHMTTPTAVSRGVGNEDTCTHSTAAIEGSRDSSELSALIRASSGLAMLDHASKDIPCSTIVSIRWAPHVTSGVEVVAVNAAVKTSTNRSIVDACGSNSKIAAFIRTPPGGGQALPRPSR